MITMQITTFRPYRLLIFPIFHTHLLLSISLLLLSNALGKMESNDIDLMASIRQYQIAVTALFAKFVDCPQFAYR